MAHAADSDAPYRGRFAPTPSGPLHLGSLLTALASFLDARHANGRWLVRMDDLDRPRCVAGMDATILRQLEAHGLAWDEPVRYQTRHRDEYRAALDELGRAGLLYACTCTRTELARDSRPGPDGPVYARTCRAEPPSPGAAALRIAVPPQALCFDDAIQARQCRVLDRDVGDFVVRRADGVPAYQLACAVDESALRITHVVRGADLLGSTFRQLHLQQRLGLRPALYAHLPVIVDAQGRKLSKQNRAAPIDPARASANLLACLVLLGQDADPHLRELAPAEILRAAAARWDASRIARQATLLQPGVL